MKKKLLSFGLALLIVLSTALSVYAYDMNDFWNDYQAIEEEEWRRMEEVIHSDNPSAYLGVVVENYPRNRSTYPFCTNCGGSSIAICYGEATLIDEGYHKGFLGIFNTDCYAYYFVSHAGEICTYCLTTLWEYDEHYCWERHMKCSKGDYNVCIFGGPDGY